MTVIDINSVRLNAKYLEVDGGCDDDGRLLTVSISEKKKGNSKPNFLSNKVLNATLVEYKKNANIFMALFYHRWCLNKLYCITCNCKNVLVSQAVSLTETYSIEIDPEIA